MDGIQERIREIQRQYEDPAFKADVDRRIAEDKRKLEEFTQPRRPEPPAPKPPVDKFSRAAMRRKPPEDV